MVGTAQHIPAPKGCGYDHYVHALDRQFPGFKSAADEVFKRVKLRSPEDDLAVYTIPVVVHIVWANEEENLPDSLINAVIEVLNEDYRRLNADADQVRDEFLDVVGDPGIEFELVGVERVETDTTFSMNILANSMPDNVKTSTGGGSDAWDTESHLNIWVCNIQGGALLGYAYPPAGLDHWPAGVSAPSPELDGVVVHYEVFRRTGTYTSSGLLGLGEQTIPVRGRTITHEVGHYLGLRHIWGDGLLSILGIPDCSEDDGVSDTPNQGASSQFVCDPEQNSCGSGDENDLPDMFENYMDYSSEDCLNSFTQGQIDIMRSVLENERNGLVAGQTTSTIAIEDSEEFEVFPNPAIDRVFIKSNTTDAGSYEVLLFDLQGRRMNVAASTQNTFQQNLNVSKLPVGLYTLMIRKDDRHYFQKVLVQ